MLYDSLLVRNETCMDKNDEPGVIVAHFTATLYLHSQGQKEDQKNYFELGKITHVTCYD